MDIINYIGWYPQHGKITVDRISLEYPLITIQMSIEITKGSSNGVATARHAGGAPIMCAGDGPISLLGPGENPGRKKPEKSREVCQTSGVTMWQSIKWLSQKWKIDGDLGNPTWYIGYHVLEWAIWLCPKMEDTTKWPHLKFFECENDYQQRDGMQYPTFHRQTLKWRRWAIRLDLKLFRSGVFPPTPLDGF